MLSRESAFKVAVEVENSKNRPYRLSPFEQYSDCDWQTAYHGADVIVKLDPSTYPEVIGVVGPACSGAAMGSSTVVKRKNISMVSFAATAEPITADRGFFGNLFRTVYVSPLVFEIILEFRAFQEDWFKMKLVILASGGVLNVLGCLYKIPSVSLVEASFHNDEMHDNSLTDIVLVNVFL